MGRTDAVPFMQQCIAEWQRLGARVTLEAGWDTRGNGSAANYEGAVVHHTAFISSQSNPFPARNTLIKGRPDLAGPLCNVAGPWCADSDPWLHVISARPANHAGASGGKSMGPLPVTGSFNARVVGLEIDYSGLAPMTAGQYRAALIFARGVVNVLGRSVEHVRAHAETSVTGKWDPGYANGKTIDMAGFRRDAANLAATTKDWFDMVSRDEMKDLLRSEIADRHIATKPDGSAYLLYEVLRDLSSRDPWTNPASWAVADRPVGGKPGEYDAPRLWQIVLSNQAESAGLRAAIQALAEARGDELDVNALLTRVDATVRDAMVDGLKVSVSVDADRDAGS